MGVSKEMEDEVTIKVLVLASAGGLSCLVV